MKLLMFDHDGGRRLGALREGHEDQVVDLSPIANDLLALIDAGDPGLAEARKMASSSATPSRPLDGLKLLSPLDPPRGNILAIGRNYPTRRSSSPRRSRQ
jgi:hypothetical protein